MTDRIFDRPGNLPHRKSVVREGGTRARPIAAVGGANVKALLHTYKYHIIIGAAVLAVLIAYKLYSQRASMGKTEDQLAKGISAIRSTAANERPPLQVDPEVIEVLQNQVLSYQQQVAELEQQLESMNQYVASAQHQQRAQQQQPQQQQFRPLDPAEAQMAAFANGVGGGAPTRNAEPSMGAFAGGGQLLPATSGMESNMGGSDYASFGGDGVTSMAAQTGGTYAK